MILNAKTRKIILAVPFSRELCNLIVNFLNKRFYKKINQVKHFDKKNFEIERFQTWKKMFYVGNGPSLTIDQLNTNKK